MLGWGTAGRGDGRVTPGQAEAAGVPPGPAPAGLLSPRSARLPRVARRGHHGLFDLRIPGSGRISPGGVGPAGAGRDPATLFLLPGRGSPGWELGLGRTCKRLLELRLERARAPAPGMRNPLSVPPRSPTSPGCPEAFVTFLYLLPSLQSRSPRPFPPAACRPLLWATDSIFSLPLAFLGQIRLIVTKCWLSLEKTIKFLRLHLR